MFWNVKAVERWPIFNLKNKWRIYENECFYRLSKINWIRVKDQFSNKFHTLKLFMAIVYKFLGIKYISNVLIIRTKRDVLIFDWVWLNTIYKRYLLISYLSLLCGYDLQNRRSDLLIVFSEVCFAKKRFWFINWFVSQICFIRYEITLQIWDTSKKCSIIVDKESL